MLTPKGRNFKSCPGRHIQLLRLCECERQYACLVLFTKMASYRPLGRFKYDEYANHLFLFKNKNRKTTFRVPFLNSIFTNGLFWPNTRSLDMSVYPKFRWSNDTRDTCMVILVTSSGSCLGDFGSAKW